MAFKDYSSPRVDKWVTIGGRNRNGDLNPAEVEGYYLGKTEGPDNFNEGKTKTTYLIRTPEGIFGVNGSSNLNRKMGEAETNLAIEGGATGSAIKITFTGTSPSKKGAPTKLFTVQFDSEDRIDAGAVLSAASENGMSDEGSDDSDDDNNDLDSALESEAPAPRAAASASNKARVDALLSKGKTGKTATKN